MCYCDEDRQDLATAERWANRPVCAVVYAVDCLAPANLDERPSRLPTCYRCGESVCVNCSRRRVDIHAGRRTRRCITCIEAEGGTIRWPEQSAS